MSSGANILAMIKADHENFFRLYDEFQASGVAEHRQHLAWQLIRDLTVHSIGEEEVLYPAMSEHMGTEVRDHALSEHKTLKNLASDLDSMKVDHPGFHDKIEMLMTALDHHIKEEENEMLPAFVKTVGIEKLTDLGSKFEKAKASAPTRPHPNAPDKPIEGNVILNKLTAPVDRLRDQVRFHGNPPPTNA
eukprot:jgi/Chrzof1/6984/Cz02g06160.t1